GRVDGQRLVVPGLHAGLVAGADGVQRHRRAAGGQLRRGGDLVVGAVHVAAGADVDAGQHAVRGVRAGRLVQQDRRLHDDVQPAAVGGVGEGGVADLLGVDGAQRVGLGPGRAAVVGVVEPVVAGAAAPGQVRQ